ncbi:MAG: MBL fold metallo-hydrolase, partial [Deltaproteobacteria bacterium]|nr:MBL fold metallo-hydrolase [Deltaproteobacteria bacterium]
MGAARLKGAGLGVLLLAGCLFSGPRHRGAATANFDGERFQNARELPRSTFPEALSLSLAAQRGPWDEWRERPPGPPPPRRVGTGTLRATFINHATVLLQLDGVNVLTDPIWSERCSPLSFAGPRRHVPPGLRLEDLPPIDAVAVSHNHYDHLDVPTLKALSEHFAPRIFVGLGNRALLEAEGIRHVEELDWWQEAELAPGVTLHGVPAQHFSNRGLLDGAGTLWLGYVLESAAGAAFFAGDTAYTAHFEAVRHRFGPPRLAVLPIGAFRPEPVMSAVHMSPEQALQAHLAL